MNYLSSTDLRTVKVLEQAEFPSKVNARNKVVEDTAKLIKELGIGIMQFFPSTTT